MEGSLFPLFPLCLGHISRDVGWTSLPNIGEIGEIGTLPCFPLFLTNINRGNRDPLVTLEPHRLKSMEGSLFPQLRPLHVGWRSFPNIGEIGEIGTLPCFPQCADRGNRGNRDPLSVLNICQKSIFQQTICAKPCL